LSTGEVERRDGPFAESTLTVSTSRAAVCLLSRLLRLPACRAAVSAVGVVRPARRPLHSVHSGH